MLYKLTAVILTSGLVSSASAALNFYCPNVNATGFYPACCIGITGQVGVDCEHIYPFMDKRPEKE